MSYNNLSSGQKIYSSFSQNDKDLKSDSNVT